MKKAPTQAQIEARMIRDEKRELKAAHAKIIRDFKAEMKRLDKERKAILRVQIAVSKACSRQVEKIKRRQAILAGRSHI